MSSTSSSFDVSTLQADAPFIRRDCSDEDCVNVYDLSSYLWIVVVTVFLAFATAYGIGANDVANAFGTSVGAKSLTLKQAVCLAGIFEFSGAFFLGAHVTDTIRGKISDLDCFSDLPATLMYGMQCTVFVVGMWLVLASKLRLPVSTTHSTVGGIIGFALVSGGSDCVVWYEKETEFPYVTGVVSIVLSWIISPVLSAIGSFIIFFFVRLLVLRSDSSYQRAFMVYPVLVGFTLIINIFFIIYKGGSGMNTDETDAAIACAWSFGLGGGVALLSILALPFFRRKIDEEFRDGDKVWNDLKEEDNMKKIETGESLAIEAEPESEKKKGLFSHNVHSSIKTDEKVHDIHEHAEKFDSKTERVFTYLQVVANAMAPFATVYIVYKTGIVDKKSELGDNAYWILAIGGAGIVVGLATYGYTIIEAIGVQLSRITPSRGFSIELGAAIIIIVGSRYGIPLSTTHCQVGATMGVGILEGNRGVNWLLFARIFAGWVLTLVIVGFSVALVFAQGLYAPGNEPIMQTEA